MAALKEFFARYSYDSVKMLLNQLVIGVFGLTLTFATAGAGSDTVMMVCSVGSVIFYLFLLYNVAWRMGDIDRGSIKMGNLPYRPLTGLWVSLVANLPTLIVAVVYLVLDPSSQGLGAGNLVGYFINGAYSGILSLLKIGETNLHTFWWAYPIIILPSLGICTLAYALGAKGKMLTKLNAYQPPVSDRPTKAEMKEREKQDKK